MPRQRRRYILFFYLCLDLPHGINTAIVEMMPDYAANFLDAPSIPARIVPLKRFPKKKAGSLRPQMIALSRKRLVMLRRLRLAPECSHCHPKAAKNALTLSD
jgi:hypothetical protein